MRIDYIPHPFLISVVREAEGDNVESDFLLKAVRFTDTTSTSAEITRCAFDLTAKGKSQHRISYSEDNLRERSMSLLKYVEQSMTKKGDPINEALREGNTYKILGTDTFWSKDQFATKKLKPNQETGFMHEHFKISAAKPIDELILTISYSQDKEERNVSTSIPVVQYRSANQYIFPVKGTWLVTANWDSPHGHRGGYSSEFAFDLAQLDGNLQVPENQRKPKESFPCYGKEILAIADGEVVDCFWKLPEISTSYTDYPREQIRQFVHEHGYVPASAGNFVILAHANGEFSFYAHLITDSLEVKKGDKVKQGQVLGRVGNSGNSTGPHLHFQIMDGPSHLTGRGLPCHFTNIKSIFGEDITLIEQDQSIVHAD